MTVMVWYLLVVVLCLGWAGALPRSYSENRNIFATDFRNALATAPGYSAHIHQVTTSDGYNLTMHRLPYRYNEVNIVPADVDKPVVFLMHGLTMASHAFVILGRELAIAYNLADAGYDVWMGNARGNIYSRSHQTLDPDHETERFPFFDFSWDEISTIDLPTMIDYVLEVTGKETLHYIGHSQGGTNFLVLNSVRPEYNAKFSSAHLLAGVGYMEYFPNQELAGLAQNVDMLYNLALLNGFVELTPVTQNNSTRTSCAADPALENMCNVLERNQIIDVVTMDGTETPNPNIESIFAGMGGSGGAAVKQYAHYGQNVQSRLFRRWNYGASGNLAAYGTEQPPLYDLSLVTVNTTMHYTVNDALLDERDVLSMVTDMPNCVARRVARDSFGHSDFIAAADARALVTDYIIDRLNEIEFSDNSEAVNIEETEGNNVNEVDLVEIVPEVIVIEEVMTENNSGDRIYVGLVTKLVIVLIYCKGVLF